MVLFHKKVRRFWRKFLYIHPKNRHILLITICFWLSCATLWTVRHRIDDRNSVVVDDNFIVLQEQNPFYTTIHRQIRHWHLDDPVVPKLFPNKGSRWRLYPAKELHQWHEVPLHSVRAIVPNNKTYHGEMGVPVKVPAHLEAQAKERQSIHQLNVVASELVSLNRRLPDVRHERLVGIGFPNVVLANIMNSLGAKKYNIPKSYQRLA